MQENQQDSQRTDILHQEEEDMKHTDIPPAYQRPVIHKLMPHNMMRHKPSDENTSQKTDYRQEYLSRNEVKPVKQRLACYGESVSWT